MAYEETGSPEYLTFSDGSEINDASAASYCISYVDSANSTEDHEAWLVGEILDTADRARAMEIVHSRGYDTKKVAGGYYGDDRDDSYRLIPRS